MVETSKMMINNETCITVADLLVLDKKINDNFCICSISVFFPEFLDGQKPKEELLAVVCEDVCQEIEKLRGMCKCLFNTFYVFQDISRAPTQPFTNNLLIFLKL